MWWNGISARGDLFYKKIKNRTPDGFKNFFHRFVVPYSGILLIACFVLVTNFAHAADSQSFTANDAVMDLEPGEVADVVNNIAPYTINYQEDAVSVALAMKDEAFLGKPIITETAKTEIAPPQDDRKNTISYTVEAGDTISSIGWKYGLTIATIKAINNLSSDTIKLGQVIKLPPGDLSPSYLKQIADKNKKKVAGASTVSKSPGSKSNAYPYGWCTYYVASKRYVPGGWGNASSWLSSAQRSGYATGSAPAVGAIVVTSESWMGHVAYVESVSGNMITVSEMNYKGWGLVSRRTIPAHSGVVRGYVY